METRKWTRGTLLVWGILILTVSLSFGIEVREKILDMRARRRILDGLTFQDHKPYPEFGPAHNGYYTEGSPVSTNSLTIAVPVSARAGTVEGDISFPVSFEGVLEVQAGRKDIRPGTTR